MVCCLEKSSQFCRIFFGAGTSVARPRVWPAVWRRSGSGLWRSSTDSAPRDSTDLNCPRQDLYRIYSKWVDELCFNHQPLYLFHGSKSMVQWINGSMDQWMEFHHFWVDRPTTRSMAVSSWFNPSKRRFALVCHDWCPGREARGAVAPSLLCNGSVNEGHSLKGVLAKRAGNCWDAMLLHLMLRYAWCANFWGKRFSMAKESTPGLSCAGQPLVMRKPHQRLRRLLRLLRRVRRVRPASQSWRMWEAQCPTSQDTVRWRWKPWDSRWKPWDWPGFFESVTIRGMILQYKRD